MSTYKGIDVSHHNGSINWKLVHDSGVQFAIAKATEGTWFTDNTFTTNVSGANNAGVSIGAYHFARFQTIEEAQQEAAFFLSAIKNVSLTYAVALDLEVNAGASVDELTAAALAFMNEVKNAGYTCLFYTYKSFLETNVNEQALRGFPFWIARYGNTLGLVADIWQYSDSGQVPGISGNVDLNTAYKDFSVGLNPPPPPPPPTYTVYTTLQGFSTAQDAKNHTNPVSTVQPGKYYIFNTSDGMINVTSQSGVPGSWINPKDNVAPSNKYVVHYTVPAYATAQDAKNNKNPKGTVSPGTYYIFNTSDGMINVTSQSGVPGSWINPKDNVAPSNKYVVHYTVPAYATAQDAKNNKNPKGTVSPGTYYIFNTSDGMINVTSQSGVPGSWINPKDNVAPSNKYVVHHTIPGYATAQDAKNHTNPKGTVSPGTYYIFNTSQGMINVTKKSGVPGSWINPKDN